MPELVKAELRQLNASFEEEIERDTWCTVQFNPESLKVSYANQLVQSNGAGDQNGTPARQFVGAGTTKLALQLWFDVTAPQPPGDPAVDDVRRLTQKVAFFITPKEAQGTPKKLVPPAVRFLWGSFQFDGMMDSLEESLEFFSPEGVPLRASLTIALSQQRITRFTFRGTNGSGAAGGPLGGPPGAAAGGAPSPGTTPLTPAPAGASLQALAAGVSAGADWQSIAAANGIENPRLLAAGQLVDLNARASVSVSGGAGAGGSVGFSAGIGG